MRKCGSCGNEYGESCSRCPKCGASISITTFESGGQFSSWLDSQSKLEKSGILVNKGVELLRQGRYAEAEAAYREAIAVCPQNAVAHGNMSHALLLRGKAEEAIPWLEKALQLDPMLEGAAQALDDAREAVRKGKASLTEHEIRQLKEPSEPTPRSFWRRLFGRRQTPRVRFVRKYQNTLQNVLGSNLCTYERYEAQSVADAISFLETRAVTKPLYYVEVDTPEGLVGKDVKGVYKM